MKTDKETMTEAMRNIAKIEDVSELNRIVAYAQSRRRSLKEQESLSWMVGDEVQLLPEHQNRKPYDVIGIIRKINKVTISVDFGNLRYKVGKSMLMKVAKEVVTS